MVSIVQTTPDGKHICPNCDDEYEPEFETKAAAKENGDIVAVEQHLTGLCSDACWNEYLGVPTEE